jgi:tetratricopeptide (TPR) repeat protein/tRNA A-37 threonylcarbamoyl transferase component Bud32
MATHGSDLKPTDQVPSGPSLAPSPTADSGVGTQPRGDAPRVAAPPAATGRYELLDEIAQGGMGIVYRATDAALGREVAVKVLKERFAPDSAAARRFVDEARITGQLQHPGIPPLHDVGTGPDGRPFLAMKLIKGRTLDQLLRERSDPAHDRGRFVAVFEQVCQAVAFAHSHMVIHRDLKPPNVMVGSFGEVQVMDWGLAKVLTARPRAVTESEETIGTEIRSLRERDGSETQAGSVLGTLAFMPPEQAVGAIDQVDQQSDVFGLGAILAVILTGSPPFVGDTAESTRVLAARGKVADCFGRLDGCGAEPGLVALCKRCLAPERADRPRDAGEVARAVAGLRADAGERARQAELNRVRAEAEAREQRKRRRVQAALGVALLVAGALVGFGLWWEERWTSNLERERTAARDAAREQLAIALDRAAAAFQADHLADADAALERAVELLETADAPDLRNRYHDLRADRTLVGELDRVWARANAIVDPGGDDRVPNTTRRAGGLRFDEDAARTGYPAALAARGLTVGSADLAEPAAQITRSAVRNRVIAALDDWLPVAATKDRPWLCDLLARVDPDPARNEIRRAHAEPDRLRTLFTSPPPEAALRLAARAAVSAGVPDAPALTVLRAAAARHPDDFRTLYAAGVRALRDDPTEAVGYFRAATGLSPDNLAAVHGIGYALHLSGKPQAAAPYFLRAIELDPGYGSAYLNLADAIKLNADPAPAVAYFEREIGRNAHPAMAHFGLGMVLRDHDPKAAAAAFRKSLALDDTFAMAHNYLGYVLWTRAELDERIRCYRRAIELDPTFAFSHYNLANSLRAKGDGAGAVTEYREALKHFPEHTFSHLELGRTLWALNDRQGAATHLRRVIELNPTFADAHRALGQVLLEADDVAGAVDNYRRCVQRFPAWYVGYDGLVLALGRTGAHAEAVRIYCEALIRADQTWPQTARRRLRYNAACAAVLAGAGSGQDAPPPADRPVFRQQALGWLQADLVSYQKDVESDPAASRGPTHKVMKHWLADTDLASTRDAAAVGMLPETERDAWKQLWGDVRRLQAATAPPAPAPSPGPPK